MLKQRWWQEITPRLDEILALPFLQELKIGALAEEVFYFYLIQDRHYLCGIKPVLRKLIHLAPTPEYKNICREFFYESTSLELQMQSKLLEFIESGKCDTKPMPVCENYLQYLNEVADLENFVLLLSALLPCFWIYHEVGKRLQQDCHDQHPYKLWIDLYAGDIFAGHVNILGQLTEALMSDDEEIRQRMQTIFAAGVNFEKLFWQESYDLAKCRSTLTVQ